MLNEGTDSARASTKKVLPADRRARIKAIGTNVVTAVTTWKTEPEGIEDEFFYRIPDELRTELRRFEDEMWGLDNTEQLRAGEISIVCSTFRHARHAARERGLDGLCDWLQVREHWWHVRMHWRDRNYLGAASLGLLGVTTGFGTSISRWAVSLLVVVIGFALLNRPFLTYEGHPASVLESMYWSIVTISTLGYGDVLPKGFPAQLIAGAEALVGLISAVGLGMVVSDKVRRL